MLATAASGRLAAKQTRSALVKVDRNYDDFSLIELTDLNGKVLATSRAVISIDVAGQDWFRTAAAGQPVVTSLLRQGDHIRWIIAQPVMDRSGRPEAVVIGDLDPTVLNTLLNPELHEGNEIIVADAQHHLLYSSEMGEVADDAEMLAAGVLSTTVDNAATQQALSTGEPGVARFIDLEGHDVIGGYDVVEDLQLGRDRSGPRQHLARPRHQTTPARHPHRRPRSPARRRRFDGAGVAEHPTHPATDRGGTQGGRRRPECPRRRPRVQ